MPLMGQKILITGVSGLLGNNLAAYLREKNLVMGTYSSHPVSIPGVRTLGLNLLDYLETRALVTTFHPDVLINCASRTDVDLIEKEKEEAWQANVLTTRVLLDSLRDMETKFIHISTDSVYSGERGPYKEDMKTNPCNWYGETKLESERLVSMRDGSLILRTNLYGWNIQDKQSLAEWFLKRFQNGQQIKGFSDARFSSIYTFLFADIIGKCVERGLKGTYNCACHDSWTKFEFGQRLADTFDLNPGHIVPVKISEAGLRARRGKNLSLDVTMLEQALGEKLPSMTESLHMFFQDWKRGVPTTIKKRICENHSGVFYPKREEITYGRQALDQADINAVVQVLKSQYLTQGNEICRFEEEVAAFVGAKFAVAVSSGTAALHLAYLSCGLKTGDDAVTSPNTFLASANCIVYCGGRPIFADIDEQTYNISPYELDKKITKKTCLVIPVHFAGQSCDMELIKNIALKKERQYGHKIYVIEDASHALGSLYRGSKVGACEYSHAAIFSFHPVKHVTTGEGGMVVTNNQKLADKVRLLRSHGTTNDPRLMCQSQGPWYYEQIDLGFNYRLTDIQCSLGRSQLKKLTWFQKRRRKIVEEYNRAFKGLKNVIIPFEHPECESNFHLYVLNIDFKSLGMSRSDMMDKLRSEKIHTQVHYIPVHLQPYYQKRFGTKQGDCPNAEKYYARCISIPLYPAMSDNEVERVIAAVIECFGHK